jgi:hypothetical protein
MRSTCRHAAIVVSALALMACTGQTASTSQSSPASQDPLVKQYQAMLSTDEQKVLASQSNNCITLDDKCPTAAAAVVAALQQWLVDLNAPQPPARFAYVDAQMRRHIARAISDLNSGVTAYMAKDQAGMDSALTAAVSERDAIVTEVSDVTASRQGTIATYTTAVRLDRAMVLACALCQKLLVQNQVLCQASQTPTCVDEISATRLQVEIFQGDLVGVWAPESLAVSDGRLQSDLFAADLALNAMASALLIGDQVALQAGDYALRLALSRADSDAADILKAT